MLAPKLSVDWSMIFVYVSFICDGTSAIIGYLRRGSAEMSPRRDLRDEQVDHDHRDREDIDPEEQRVQRAYEPLLRVRATARARARARARVRVS